MNRILFVDDEQNVISGLKRQLKKPLTNCEIFGVNSGKEALRFVKETAVDTIVLDICMPEMDGLEVLSLLKANPKTKRIPVIMLTGCAEKELKHKALDLGAYDYVNKPADPYELTARLKGSLCMKSYEDQLKSQNAILERQLLKAQEMENIGLLACTVAHDLNNILAVASGNTELAINRTRSDTKVAANLNATLESCAHGAELVQQILRLVGGFDSGSESHDLNDTIDKNLALLSITIPKGIEVIWTKPHNACIACIDQTQVMQLLMNLITNAVHAMDGSGALTIGLTEVSADSDPLIQSENRPPISYIRLSIADTGRGMDRSTLDHIFDPFFTTKEKGRGTGIGLSVVNLIVKNMQGHVTVDSTVGAGTTFHVYLPAELDPGNVNQQEEGVGIDGRKKTNSFC